MTMKTKSTRRSFVLSSGAALSASLTVAAAEGVAARADTDELRAQLERLEDVSAIRDLNQRFAQHVSERAREELGRLFADAAGAAFDDCICGLAAHGSEQDTIEIATDRTTAMARIHCTVQIAAPIEPSCPLVEMARAQGGGVTKCAENGVVELAYVKRAGVWKIERSAYRSA